MSWRCGLLKARVWELWDSMMKQGLSHAERLSIRQEVRDSIQASGGLILNKVYSFLNIPSSMLPSVWKIVVQIWPVHTLSHPLPAILSIPKSSDIDLDTYGLVMYGA